MKRLIIGIIAVLLLFSFASAVNAQKNSRENSDVVLHNEWWESYHPVYCEATGFIGIYAMSHVTHKQTPSGNWSGHYNVKGEGYDEFGGEWTFHSTSNYVNNDEDIHYSSIAILHGPKGAKLKMRVLFIEKDGKIQIDKFEPYCE